MRSPMLVAGLALALAPALYAQERATPEPVRSLNADSLRKAHLPSPPRAPQFPPSELRSRKGAKTGATIGGIVGGSVGLWMLGSAIKADLTPNGAPPLATIVTAPLAVGVVGVSVIVGGIIGSQFDEPRVPRTLGPTFPRP